MGFQYGDVAVDGEKLYIAPAEIAGIIEADINTGESRILVKFPQYNLLAVRMNSAICKSGDYIAVAPLLGTEFYLYNIKKDQLISLTIDEEKFINLSKKSLGKRGLFAGSFIYNNCFYFVGYCYSGIVKISIDRAELEVFNLDLKKLKKICASEEIFLGRCICVKDDCVYVPVKYTDTIIKYNMSNDCCEYITLGYDLSIYEICIENNDVYLLLSDKKELMHIELNNLRNVNILNVLSKKSEKNGEPWFVGGICKAGYVWIFPYFSNMILKLSLNTGNVECVKENREYGDGYIYTFVKDFDEDHICAFNSKECCLDIMNVYTQEVRKLYLSFSDDAGKYALSEILCSSEKHLINESSIISLSNMISFIKTDDMNKTSLDKTLTDKTLIGKTIWTNT